MTNAPLLAELARVLVYKKVLTTREPRGFALDDLVLGDAELATPVTPAAIGSVMAADPTDDRVLTTALAAQADLVVSGDICHLLALGSSQATSIVTAEQAVKRITALAEKKSS